MQLRQEELEMIHWNTWDFWVRLTNYVKNTEGDRYHRRIWSKGQVQGIIVSEIPTLCPRRLKLLTFSQDSRWEDVFTSLTRNPRLPFGGPVSKILSFLHLPLLNFCSWRRMHSQLLEKALLLKSWIIFLDLAFKMKLLDLKLYSIRIFNFWRFIDWGWHWGTVN